MGNSEVGDAEASANAKATAVGRQCTLVENEGQSSFLC